MVRGEQMCRFAQDSVCHRQLFVRVAVGAGVSEVVQEICEQGSLGIALRPCQGIRACRQQGFRFLAKHLDMTVVIVENDGIGEEEERCRPARCAAFREGSSQVGATVEKNLGQPAVMTKHLTTSHAVIREKDCDVEITAGSGLTAGGRTTQHRTGRFRIARGNESGSRTDV